MPSRRKIRLTRTEGRGTIAVPPSAIKDWGYANGGSVARVTLHPGTLMKGGTSEERLTVEESPMEIDRLMQEAQQD